MFILDLFLKFFNPPIINLTIILLLLLIIFNVKKILVNLMKKSASDILIVVVRFKTIIYVLSPSSSKKVSIMSLYSLFKMIVLLNLSILNMVLILTIIKFKFFCLNLSIYLTCGPLFLLRLNVSSLNYNLISYFN